MACDSAGHHDCNTNAHMANHAGIERLRNRFMRQMISEIPSPNGLGRNINLCQGRWFC